MNAFLYFVCSCVAYGVLMAFVFRGCPAIAAGSRWVLRRALGVRPRQARHRRAAKGGDAR